MSRTVPTISLKELEALLISERPDNRSRERGFALIDVRPEGTHRLGHIPGASHVDSEDVARVEGRFDQEKTIVLYCQSMECPLSETVAAELQQRGYGRAITFPGGADAWVEGGHELVREA